MENYINETEWKMIEAGLRKVKEIQYNNFKRTGNNMYLFSAEKYNQLLNKVSKEHSFLDENIDEFKREYDSEWVSESMNQHQTDM